jgi:integrase
VITDPATGQPKMKRKQLTITKDTKTEVKDELARIRHQRSAGTYVAPAKITVSALLDLWLKSATRDVEEATASNYDNALRPVRKYLGHKPVQELIEEDVEAFIDWMVSEGRQRGGKPGTGLGIRSVRLTLGRLRSALNLAVRRGLVVRNVAEHVTISKQAKEKAQKNAATHKPWNEEEVKRFLEGIQGHRSYAPMLLALIAERPAEVCGARWSPDVDLTAGAIAVGTNTRTIVYDRTQERGQRNKVVEKGGEDRGREAHAAPAEARPAGAEGVPRHAGGGEAGRRGGVRGQRLRAHGRPGRPWKTDKLRREAHKLMATTGVRKVRLYDARHACLSWMANNGVPDTVVSAWAGHSDLGFTKRTYVHPDPQSLKAGSEKLAELLG